VIARIVNKVPAIVGSWAGGESERGLMSEAVAGLVHWAMSQPEVSFAASARR
jgi:hypothetical protein